MKSTFDLFDIEMDMTVELRDGTKLKVSEYNMRGSKITKDVLLEDYNPNMTHKEDRHHNIMMIYDENGELLFKREGVINRAYAIEALVQKHIELGMLMDDIESNMPRNGHIDDEVQEVLALLVGMRAKVVEKMKTLLGD